MAHKVAAMKVNVIFAVTENQINVYRNLSAFIEGSTVGMLANDSSNIVELVKDNYDVWWELLLFKTLHFACDWVLLLNLPYDYI